MSEAPVALTRAGIESAIRVKQQILAEPALVEQAGALGDRIGAVLRAGGRLLLFGNRGSAAAAQHIAAALIGRFRAERRRLAAIALTTDTSILTASATITDSRTYSSVRSKRADGRRRRRRGFRRPTS